jgi:hypothetical protein
LSPFASIAWRWGSNTLELRRTLDRIEAEAEGWFKGPPYAVAESVFDEYEQEGCTLTPEF